LPTLQSAQQCAIVQMGEQLHTQPLRLVQPVLPRDALLQLVGAELASYRAAVGTAPRGIVRVHLPFTTQSVRKAAAQPPTGHFEMAG
jgi:hypothetical protein